MQPNIKSGTPVSWGIPAVLWLASLAILVAGLVGDSALIGIGFVMITTSVIVTSMAFGTATAVMGVSSVQLRVVAPADLANEAFFPKGAIAFFVAMISFFGATWLGLYALMIYRNGI